MHKCKYFLSLSVLFIYEYVSYLFMLIYHFFKSLSLKSYNDYILKALKKALLYAKYNLLMY